MTTRRAAGTVIVGSWVCCIGWAVARQVGRPTEAYLEARAARLAPGAAFYQITLGDRILGNAGITLDTSFAGYRLTEVWNMDLARKDSVERFVYRSDAELSRSLKLRYMSITMSEAGLPRMLEAKPNNDTTWEVTMRRPAARPIPLPSIDLPASGSAPGAIPYRLVLEGRLSSGNSIGQPVLAAMYGTTVRDSALVTRDSVFMVADSAAWDSTSSSWQPVTLGPTRAWRLERTIFGFPAVEWIDGLGRLVQREWAFGLTLSRTPFEINYNVYQNRLRRGEVRPPEGVAGAIARVHLDGAPDPTKRELTVRIARLDGPAWPGAVAGFAGGRQSVRGDTVVVRADQVPEALVALTRSSGAATRTDRVAHFLAAAGSAGYETRVVSGIDLSRAELPGHAWVEVRIDGAWVAVDPIYGQAPASVSLLRVVVGGSDRPLVLVPLIGSLKPTTLAIQ